MCVCEPVNGAYDDCGNGFMILFDRSGYKLVGEVDDVEVLFEIL